MFRQLVSTPSTDVNKNDVRTITEGLDWQMTLGKFDSTHFNRFRSENKGLMFLKCQYGKCTPGRSSMMYMSLTVIFTEMI